MHGEQHEHISDGERAVREAENLIDLALAKVKPLRDASGFDARAVAVAVTNIETGRLWIRKAKVLDL